MPVWLLILLVVGLALAPLWHFRPSSRQREQARLRERAALAGLYVELRPLPLPAAAAARLGAADREALCYGLRLPPARGRRRPVRSWWRREDGAWCTVDGAGEPPAAVAALPPWALAAAIDEHGCGVYWREAAGPEAVDAIAAALQAWRDGES